MQPAPLLSPEPAKLSRAQLALRGVFWFVLLPLLTYLASFILMTWPLIRLFSTHFYCDAGDGFQNAWNIWWVNKAITQLHQSPFHTHELFFPHGVTLLGHTLNPFDGLLCIPLLRFLSLVQAYNVVIIFSFAAGGWTAFLLAYRFSRSYLGALAGGFIFTFSGYHFAHGNGHMQLIALEWMPLAVLCIYEMLTKPRVWIALAAAFALWLTLLCDYYYFFYTCIAAVLLLGVRAWQERSAFFIFRRAYWPSLLAFVIGAALTSGPIVGALLVSNYLDPLTGQHDPTIWSADLYAPFIPGESWRWGALTKSFWLRLPEASHLGWPHVIEGDVYLGWLVLASLGLIAFKRARRGFADLGFWYLVLALFWILSLGPYLNLNGQRTAHAMPYKFFEMIFPPLKLSGMPVRMMVMPMLASGVIFACAFRFLTQRLRRLPFAVVTILLLSAVVIERWPRPIARTSPAVPEYVLQLRSLPGHGGVIDTVSNMFEKLYYQTVHEKPIAGGYISREPTAAVAQRSMLDTLAWSHDYDTLHVTYGFDYLVTRETIEDANARLVYSEDRENGVRIYAIGSSGAPPEPDR